MKPLVLCILDGFGIREDAADNAITNANTPYYDHLTATYPTSQLATSGEAVGLPEGQMGNSEVGHMTIGCGRIILQNLPLITRAITDGSLAAKQSLKKMIETLKASGKTCHLMGLLSDGGVHAHQDHIIGVAKIIAARGIAVKIHAFLDGRDTAPQSALGYIEHTEAAIADLPISIATVAGRFYAMDRDNRWDRVEKAYSAIAQSVGPKAASAAEAVNACYGQEVFDEFVVPTIVDETYAGIDEGDALIMANFRSDRAREILQAMVDPAFDGFARQRQLSLSHVMGMVEYSDHLNQWCEVLFPVERPRNSLSEVLQREKRTQLRIAETEKYAHVTFFFNGGDETVFEGEERILVPSPNVATYDLQPEMSAPEVTDKVIAAIESEKFDVIIVNYANTDMVGHCGDQSAAIAAVEAVDQCLSRIGPALLEKGGAMLVTADHGNVEQMLNAETGQPHTAHTTGPVPLILCSDHHQHATLQEGSLQDIAPTMLSLLKIAIPQEMTGVSLVHE